MTSLDRARAGFRLNGWHVLGLFAAFFGIIAVVNGAFIAHAFSSYPGEVSTTPYEDGLAYDNVLRENAAQSAMGWRVVMGFKAPGLIELHVTDRAGAPVTLNHIEAAIERPATLRGRQVLAFASAAPGVYLAKARVGAGAWDLTLTAYGAKGQRFEGGRRLLAPGAGA